MLGIVHALEYLWRAAYAFHADGTPAAEAWVEHQLVKLLSGRSGGEIAKSMRLMAQSHEFDAAAARPAETAASYLVKHARLLHYDRALADGLPIATGVIEGACRYHVQDRMGRTGARWSLTGAVVWGARCSGTYVPSAWRSSSKPKRFAASSTSPASIAGLPRRTSGSSTPSNQMGAALSRSRSTGAIPITVRQMKTDEEDERRAETSCSASAGDGPARQGVATQSVPSVAWS